jgi:hypothetical protein
LAEKDKAREELHHQTSRIAEVAMQEGSTDAAAQAVGFRRQGRLEVRQHFAC